MLIGLSYTVGEDSQFKYFEHFDEMVDFLNQCIEVFQVDFKTYEITIFRNEEEKRVRKLKGFALSTNEVKEE